MMPAAQSRGKGDCGDAGCQLQARSGQGSGITLII
jgi:hypothetical protein